MKAREFIVEFEEQDIGYYNPEDDDLSRAHFSDTRKPVLTLKELNRLKRIRVTRKIDNAKKQDLLDVMYSVDDEEETSGGF